MDNPMSTQKSGDNSATRRNTRSTSNQEKEKTQDIPESSKSNSSNSSTKDRDCVAMEVSKKKACDRVERGPNGDVLSYTTEDDTTYRLSDSAYLETARSDAPYSICTIQEIKSKRDSAIVYVKWYYRPTEVPDLVYQMLIKNRYNQVDDSEIKNLIMNQDVINRELFLDERMEATDSFPISNLKGKCQVSHYTDVAEIKKFELKPDHFFYICSYSPENRRLASSKGETRVGPSHQWSARMRGMFQKAELPDLLHPVERGYEKGRDYEEMTWQPNVDMCDLIMCLRAARSLAAFAGVCDGVLPEDGCIAACRDDTTINALRVLFENSGNPRKAIDYLVKNPVPVTIESKWTDEQVKRFQRGLRHHGKNFFRIKNELLPTKETADLVEFYYLSKKSQDNLMIRSHNRKQRRQATLKKPEGKPKLPSYGSGDHTSTEDETESEESEKEVNLKCAHCQKPTENGLKNGGKENMKLCLDCRLFFKKYGENRPVVTLEEVESTNETDMDSSPAPKSTIPPFLFKPIKEEKVNVLFSKKQTKNLSKVKLPTEIKKPTKREWPDDIKTEQFDEMSSKRPKSEPEENEEQSPTGDQHCKAFIREEIPSADITTDNPNPENQYFPLPRNSLPPGIIPHEIEKFPSSLSASAAKQTVTYENTTNSLSSGKVGETYTPSIGPFVPAAQMSQRLSVKPSELEAISKLAMSPGSISGGRYPTVAYSGTLPPNPVLPPSQGNGVQSPSCSTTVTTTNGVRATASVEQPTQTIPPRLPPRDNDQERIQKDNSVPTRTENSKEIQSKYKFPESRDQFPGPSSHRGFPFDPRVTDQIISNANIARPIIKEEARSSSPLHREVARSMPSHVSLPRESMVHHGVKQEFYPYHPSMHHARAGPVGVHQQLSKKLMYPTSQSSSRPTNHRSSPDRAHQSSLPPTHSSKPNYEQSDSDVELIRETRPPSPAVPVEIPCSFGNSARFLKTWDRGSNSCFRTDFVFAVDEASRKRRQERQREEKKIQQEKDAAEAAKTQQPKRPPTPSPSTSRAEKSREERTEPRERPRRDTGLPPPHSHPMAYRSAPGHMSVPRSTPTPTSVFDRHTPAAFVSPPTGPPFGPDMPALRHLQQIASIDVHRNAVIADVGGVPVGPAHPLYRYYQLLGVDPEAAERELRERERLAKMGELKAHEMMNIHQFHPNALAAAGFHVAGLPGQHIPSMEQLHQYQAQLLNSLPPGAHPHSILAANMSHGAIAAAQLEAYTAERMTFERLQAERLAAEQQYQLDLLHHHSHSHVHSHLHLHGPSQGGGPPPAGTPIPMPAIGPPGPALAVGEPLLNPYVQAMGPLVSAANPLLTQSMLRNQQAAAAQAAFLQQGLASPHLSAAIAAREQAAAAAQPHPFSQHLQAFNEQHVMESQHRARTVAALQDQQYLAHAARYKP